MAENKTDINNQTTSDFFTHRKTQYFIFGFSQSRNKFYYMYRGLLLLFIATLTSFAIYGAVLVPSKTLRIDVIHYCLLAAHAIWGIITRIVTYRSLNRTKKKAQYGIYLYVDEVLDEEELRLKKKIPEEVKKKFNFFLNLCICGLISNQIFFPLSQMFSVTEEDFLIPNEWMNPYLPHLLYMPFNTRNVIGYFIAHILDSLCYCCLYFTTLSVCLVFISCQVQLKFQLQVLNHSVRNIETRAYMKYMKIVNVNDRPIPKENLFEDKKYQSCLYACFKSNVIHHQTLLRFFKDAKPFLSSSLLAEFTTAATLHAAVLYLILQTQRLNLLVNYILTFVAESAYTYTVCTFGEELIQESNKLFEAIYSISWFHYGKPFNKMLQIMMCNTTKPMQFKVMLLDIPASLECYGGLLSGMYKITNLARQSDAI